MDFRQFLVIREQAGDVCLVEEEVSPREIPARIQAEENGQDRVILFKNIADYPGSVVGNAYGSTQRINKALGAEDTMEFYRRADEAIASPEKPNFIPFEASDYIVTRNPDLAKKLPQIIHSEHDSTPYITSGVVLARHPETGRHHMCFVRLSVQEDNKVLFNPRTFRIKEIADKTLGVGEPLDIVVLIGAPSEITLLGGLSIPDEVDEVEFVQSWGGKNINFYDRDLPVPAGTEMVLIGRVEPENRAEGPFGDMRGFYITNPNPICEITEMWERPDVKYHSVLGGMSHEHIGLVSLKPRHALEQIKAQFPGVLDYHLPHYAAGQLAILRVTEDVAKEDLIQALFKVGLAELFILLNEDTDAVSPEEVLWALTQRTGDAADFSFHDADPARGNTKRTVIDATVGDLSDWRNKRVNIYE
jgi:UbiD family decarboxylase